MNKKLLAAAVAVGMVTVTTGALAAPTVKTFGRIQAAVTDLDVDNSTKGYRQIQDDYGLSRVGFIVKEKLGNGLTAIGKIAWKIDPTEKDGTFAEREQYVGLSSKAWGSFRLGTNTSPYKVAGGVKYDPWTATALESRSYGQSNGSELQTKGGMSRAKLTGFGQSGHVANSFTYYTPKMNGISAALMIVLNDNEAALNQTNGRDGSWSAAVQYKNGPMHVIFAHSNDECATFAAGACTDATLTKIGGAYKFGNHKIYGQYEWDSDGASTAVSVNQDGEFFLLGYNFKSGNNTFVAQIGGFEGEVAADEDVDYWSLGVIHKFSKKTRIFAGVRESNEDGAASNDETAITAGMRLDF